MPPSKKTYKPRRAAKAKRAPRRRMYRKKRTNVAEYASLSETRTIVAPNTNNQINTMYSLMNTSLSQFTRAPLVAQAYQHFRIKNIALRLKPPFDTFVSGATTGTAKPYLYYMLDKAGAIPTNISLEGLKQMGAKPRAFDEKQLTISWAPSVLQDVLTVGGAAPVAQGSAYKISPWLNTADTSVGTPWNASAVDHLGVYWYVEAPVAGTPTSYEIDVEVQFEFKKPLIARSTSSVHAVAVQFAQLDASPDGIVGGSDGITIPLN